MLERIEQTVTSWMTTLWVKVMSRLHPQLRELKEPRRQHWAIWFANEGARSRWRWLNALGIFVLTPAFVAALCLFIASGFDINLYQHGATITVAAIPLGTLAAASSRELLRRDDVRRRSFLAMRICGADICLRCGYNMSGHNLDGEAERRCPECGGSVEPLREWQKRQ